MTSVERIFVTGFAQISALGNTWQSFDAALLNSRSGAVANTIDLPGIDRVDVPICPSDFDPKGLIAPSKVPMDRGTAMALKVAQESISHAQLDLSQIDHERLGVFWGSGMAGAGNFDLSSRSLYVDNKRIRPTNVVTTMPNAPAAEISLFTQAYGASLSYACACASSAVAIGEALLALRSGRVDVAIVGGSEAMLTPGVVAGWQALRVLAPIAHGDAQAACRPFDVKRSGFALGEGAAALVLETQAHAQKRSANLQAQLSGYATNCDGHHMTHPHWEGQVRVIRQALRDAGLTPQDIGYINAHGTATQAGDVAEARSVTEVFGARGVPISSTKGLHGHLLGAGGAMELLISIRALQSGLLPSSANCDEMDPEMHLDVIQGGARQVSGLKHVMSNSFAFGGTNAVLIASAAN
jgi:3-oxoacyl-[acyl-carrier-protein] synthase II